jgi:hypothetical protein
MALSKTEQELAELLLRNRILLHNLLVGDAKRAIEDAEQCEDISMARVLREYGEFRQNLADSIFELDKTIIDEKLDEMYEGSCYAGEEKPDGYRW